MAPAVSGEVLISAPSHPHMGELSLKHQVHIGSGNTEAKEGRP